MSSTETSREPANMRVVSPHSARLRHDDRGDDHAARAQNSVNLAERQPRLTKVLKDVAGEHSVEEAVFIWQRNTFKIPLDRDLKPRSGRDGTPIHVDAMHFNLTAGSISAEVPLPQPRSRIRWAGSNRR